MTLEKVKKDYIAYAVILIGILVGVWFQPLMLIPFLICVYYVFSKPLKDSFYLTFFLMPFALIFKFRNYSLSFLTLIQIVIIAKFFLLNKKGIKEYFLFPFLVLLAYFLARTGTYYLAPLKIAVTCLFVYCFIETNKTAQNSDHSRLLLTFIVGLIVSSFVGILKTPLEVISSYYSDLNYQYIGGIKTLRFSGLFDDPNYYSIAVISSLLSLSALKSIGCLKTKQFAILYLLLLVFGLYTFSKSFLLMLVICFLVELLLNLSEKRFGLFTAEFGAIVVLLLFISLGGSSVISMGLSRFTSGQNFTTTRDLIWDNYLKEINTGTSSIFFGHSLGAEYVANKAAHNLYIELIYYSGVIGLAIYCIFWVCVILTNHRHIKNLFVYILPISVFVMYFFLSGFLNYAFPFYVIISWVVLQMEQNYEHNNVYETAFQRV